jgi:hypothetical protein
VAYWDAIYDRYGLDLEVVNHTIDPTFRFMTVDWDGQIRMDPPSPYAMARMVSLKDRFDVAFANDVDADRHEVLNALAKNLPWLIGGSADLAPSTKTRVMFEGAGDFSADNPAGRNLHFGIREHAMAAILNGLSLSKMRPFGSDS